MAKGIWERVRALWKLSDEIEVETVDEVLERIRKPKQKAEFLEPNRVQEIFTKKPNSSIDDTLI